jgi:hypothetical protein
MKIKWFLFSFFIIVFAGVLLRGKITHKRFDSDLWKTANLNLEDNFSLRWDMMNDLRRRYTLVGMTRKEIVELLGDPGGTDTAEFVYYLGYTGTGINTGTLRIFFNGNGLVTKVRVWQG